MKTVNNRLQETTATHATHAGHLDQEYQYKQSKTKSLNTHARKVSNEHSNVNELLIGVNDMSKLYTDQTGHFPVVSSSGHRYIMLAYLQQYNVIIVRPLRTQLDAELTETYTDIVNELLQKGINITSHWLDNQAPSGIKEYNALKNINMQLTPPYCHRRNAAERAIRTFKNHFIATIATLPNEFPGGLWDKLLAHTQLTLNMTR